MVESFDKVGLCKTKVRVVDQLEIGILEILEIFCMKISLFRNTIKINYS